MDAKIFNITIAFHSMNRKTSIMYVSHRYEKVMPRPSRQFQYAFELEVWSIGVVFDKEFLRTNLIEALSSAKR